MKDDKITRTPRPRPHYHIRPCPIKREESRTKSYETCPKKRIHAIERGYKGERCHNLSH